MVTTTSWWTAEVDGVLGGDQVVALAHVTPASGVVLSPLTNFAVRDVDAGTVVVNSSVGMWRKLERMQENPRVGLAFHTREHARSDRPEYVLVQGRAAFEWPTDPDAWLEELGDHWERFGGQPRDLGRLWERWLSVYHHRVNVEVAAERVIFWPDPRCEGRPQVRGAPWPTASPQSQAAPALGRAPRVDHGRAAKRARRLPYVLLGWVGADGFPVVVPVDVGEAEESGIRLGTPPGLVPSGGRRAGLLAHSFARYTHGQHQRRHTGWLEADPTGERVVYAPHTEAGYRFPHSTLAFRIAAGFGTRRGLREGRRAGVLPE